MRTPSTRLVALFGAAATLSFLVGCAQPSVVVRAYDGFPEGTGPPSAAPTPGASELPEPDLGPKVQWADRSRMIAVSLWGSSSCPSEPDAVEVVTRDRLAITTRARSGFLGACTADLAVRTYEIRVPASVSTSQPLTVTVDRHTLRLRPEM